ncbi:MAG: BamA/TamA family outer membrane protein [Candidatus Eisenbacteria bacterium]
MTGRMLLFCAGMFLIASTVMAGETPSGAEPRRVHDVLFHGNESIPAKQLLPHLRMQPSGRFRKTELDSTEFVRDLDRVARVYRAEGFFDVQVRGLVDSITVEPGQVDLHVAVREGVRHQLGEISFEVAGSAHRDPQLVQALRAAWGLPSGTPYRPIDVIRARGGVLRVARDHGYLDARLHIEARHRVDRIDLRAHLESGELARVRTVEITGLRKTQGRIVLREIELHPGDPILPRGLERSRRNLERTGLFRSVELMTAPEDSGATFKRIIVHTEDRKTGSLSSGVGYGLLDRFHFVTTLEQENFQGRGIRLQLDGTYAGRRRRVEAGAVFPWTLGHRLATRVAAGYEKALPRSYVSERWSSGISVSRSVDTIWKTEVGYRVDRVDVRDRGGALTRTRLGQLELALSRDSRVDLLGTSRGTFLRVSEEWLAPWLGSREHFGRTKVQARLNQPIWGPVGLRVRAFGGRIFPQDPGRPVPITELFFAGGASTLRGFPPDAVGPTDTLGVAQGAKILALSSAEIELRVKGPIAVAGFIDSGQLADQAGLFRWDHLSIGAGFGLRARPRFGTFRADIGFPVTERFSDGVQFHFATGTAFF